ncbi:BNR Asp-box repeat domain containing protein [Pyrenophora tritici-repentis]|uniref:BNR/Asp-box repeat domain containing protein n=2 Tax=Pyrenophora tritici-repentis TaxID=45151 RepID=A0A2W1FBL6_9PLEO|nr:BNR/Asp-box repeat domain containing protein [Pyrenophora tritici-repentis Pt-1C-BFP]KAA8621393.1 BNR/Asp-box repeat domain-containing protein [Pyrenophora tritici-repentis]EDU43771.1 BNR/Asp-box repeat domain containing protein [Pyrenophora tritici-repentis Pt-1C-BFP]KAF7450628.1 BNR/Asp-box repeat domain containing protein [Pyrenophora tritici-repentis]KAF7573247.1 Tymo-45kd-70kd domain containing protein [Pyrenophora tritici-repentis]KAG9381156.1 BNR/Asp-box repeat domain containing prot
MRLSTLFLSLISVVSTTVSAHPKRQTQQPTFSRNVIFSPPRNAGWTDPGVLYARSAQLSDGSILATWENYSPEPPIVYFPIYKSSDGGLTWKEISRVQDTQNGFGLRYQPTLYVLPQAIGGYPAGTVLISGSSIPTDLSSTEIELYASKDDGVTWEFVSHIAKGGRAVPNNGLTPVWEPFLMMYQNTLICYYSDQRENATYGQKMVHQSTTDLKTWGAVVNDVTYPTYTDRPGMPTVAELPNGQYIMTYEYGGGPAIPNSYQFPVYYKIVSDPTKFGEATGISLKATDGTIPSGSPHVAWSSFGGVNGTIIASAHSNSEVFINRGLGQGPWIKVATPEATSYTRHLRVLSDPTKLLIMGGGNLPPANANSVTVTVVDISSW